MSKNQADETIAKIWPYAFTRHSGVRSIGGSVYRHALPVGASIVSPGRTIDVLNLGINYFPRPELLVRGVDVIGMTAVLSAGLCYKGAKYVNKLALKELTAATPDKYDLIVIDTSEGQDLTAQRYCDVLPEAMIGQTVLAGVDMDSPVFGEYGIKYFSNPADGDVRTSLADVIERLINEIHPTEREIRSDIEFGMALPANRPSEFR